MSSPAQRIQQLRDELNSHNHAYYVDNRPTISDYEYDMLMKELERLEKENPELDDPFSPTHRVGSDITKGFEQVAHERPMLSLSNTYSVEEVDDWVRNPSRFNLPRHRSHTSCLCPFLRYQSELRPVLRRHITPDSCWCSA